MKFYQILLLAITFSSYTSINAGEVKTFDDIDSDGDGYISKKEANDIDHVKSNWTAADKDNDGKLDVSEFSAFEGKDKFQPPETMEEPEPGAAPTQ
ncbi:MAG: hypothetical protein OEX07_10225 [Gammaproteobacteria bacterium]|nr:hypothetical protein [Gammaproteobacteria bacterium]